MPGFFDAWCHAFSDDRTGFVVVGKHRHTTELIVPMWHFNEDPLRWYSLGAFRADYTEPLSKSDEPELAMSFWTWLEREAPCTSVKLSRLREESLLAIHAPRGTRHRVTSAAYTMLRRGSSRYLNTTMEREHPFADQERVKELAERIDSKETRRKLNVLAKQGPVTYRTIKARDIAPLLPTFFEMHVANFAGTGRTSQFTASRERVFYEQLAAHPDLAETVYMDILAVGDTPVAMHFGFQDAERIYWYKPAFDLRVEKGSPGRVLLAHLFARAAATGVREVDLLKGTEAYKQDWANHSRMTTTSTLVARGMRDIVSSVVERLKRQIV